MKIHKVTNIEQFVVKILPKQPQKNKSIVESILKNVQKKSDVPIPLRINFLLNEFPLSFDLRYRHY